MDNTNLFWLQSELVSRLEAAVGNEAKVLTAYDLARAKGELSSAPALYLLLDGMTPQSRRADAIHLLQRWEISLSAPVAVGDRDGTDATATLGRLAMKVLSALHTAQIPGVRQIELVQQNSSAGLVGNRLVIPFLFTAAIVQPITP